jgi:sugar phosphate isomerase/epimerase
MKTAVTVALDPCFAGGPFVFHGLSQAVDHATRLGFDALELFPGDLGTLPTRGQLGGLAVSAVGTGAGWVKHKLSLTSPDAGDRRRATDFLRALADEATALGAPVIVGSMQGRWGDGVSRADAVNHLRDALAAVPTPVLVEPLNRYESNVLNTLADTVVLTDGLPHVRVLADLFHMNIEEADLAAAIRSAGAAVGHVHLADSNRRPAGMGHTDFGPVVAALRDIGYAGYLSAECFPHPDPVAAAEATMAAVRRLTPCSTS